MGIDRRTILGLAAAVLASATLTGCNPAGGSGAGGVEILNVSYDPTRELWGDLNSYFAARYEKETGKKVTIKQSHGGSSSQARAVIEGVKADVVTLALWSDIDAIRQKGLIQDGWQQKLPHDALPYYSTIVFVVRKGNPKSIHDWPDLVNRPDVQIVTPNPKTSGNGRLSFLAAWGGVIHDHGTEQQAREFVRQLYRRVPVLDSGARGSTTTFVQNKIGDVHLTWENEARLEVREAKGEVELVYPSSSIRAEPFVAVVDSVVDHRGTRDVAEAYLRSVYEPEAQEIIARHGYRPIDETVLARHRDTLPDLTLFPVTSFVKDWGEAQTRFFADGAEFDQIYQPVK